MPDRTTVIYCYDGTLEGLLCCIFASYERKEVPADIVTAERLQLSFYKVREIETELVKAKRVEAGIRGKLTDAGWNTVRLGWHSCHPEKELLLYRFVRMGMQQGKRVLSMIADETVSELFKATQGVTKEAQRYKQFLRFSMVSGVLVAQIEPKNDLLFLLVRHFCDRYHNHAFLIHDKTYRQLLLHRPGKWAILPAEDYVMPDVREDEWLYRTLWKGFYDAIAVEGRISERQRMNHMPKRYWHELPELDPRLNRRAASEQKGGDGDGFVLPFGGQAQLFSDPLQLAFGDTAQQDQQQ